MPTISHRIVLWMHRWVGYLEGVQLGIAEYFVQRPDWMWTHVLPQRENLDQLARLGTDGVIAFVEATDVEWLKALNVPVVDVSNWLPVAHFPRVVPDDIAIGRLAAEHLMGLGLKHFGFVGPLGASFCELRSVGFNDALVENGFKSDFCTRDMPLAAGVDLPPGANPAVLAWLLSLPKPVGVFGANDVFADEVLSICHRVGLQVPEQVCVLGVDNDELLSKVSQPPLSSIALQNPKIGFEAAKLLDQLLSGQPAPPSSVLLPPVGVVSRQSTNLLSIEDEDVLAAVRYIRERAHEQVTVADVLEVVPVNRRYLERKFKEHLHRTPLQEIQRVRMEKAMELLATTELSMPAIARRSGFPNPERLANVFRATNGMTPTEYRRKFRLQDF